MNAEPNSGFCWHEYHDVLFGWCCHYKERRYYIETAKPEAERELRLRLFRPVRGKLPEAVVEAWRVRFKTLQAYDEGWPTFDGSSYDEALRARVEARRAFHKAIADHFAEIEALHEIECPDCPWDGETIFPEEAVEVGDGDE